MKYLLGLSLLAIFVSTAAAQSVTVTPNKVVYKRTGSGVPDFKREFEIRYPVFSGELPADALKNLKEETDYWKLFEMTLEENLGDYHWLSGCDYDVKYNRDNILDIWLSCEGVGAYPSGSSKFLVFDLRTGNKIEYSDIFSETQFPGLTKAIRGIMKAEEKKLDSESRQHLLGNREDYPGHNPKPDQIELKDLAGFSISDKGVTFKYNYNYPHVAKALEPSGDFFLSYSKLKPFIRPDGLLGRFAR